MLVEHRGGDVVELAVAVVKKCFDSLPDIDYFFECFWW